MRSQLLAASAIVVLVCAAGSPAAVIMIDPDTLNATDTEDFESFGGGGFPGTNYDGIVDGNGVSFAERFFGQTSIAFATNWDLIMGLPSGELALQVGDPGENLTMWAIGENDLLAGNGPLGWPFQDSVGEGAVSMLFDIDQMEFGIELLGASGGNATFDFYARDGSFIDSITMIGLVDGAVAFRSTDGSPAIAGVVMSNYDLGGMAYDNLLYSIPAPQTVALFALAGLARRRRRA